MATAGNLIGKVTVLAGHATARSLDGAVRELKLGDPVFEGDVITTDAGGKVEIAFDGGRNYVIGGSETVTLDGQVFDPAGVEARDAALLPARGELGPVTDAIINGNGSLDALLEETAAGVNGGGGDDNGSSFVELARVQEDVTPVDNQTTPIATDTEPVFRTYNGSTESVATISVDLPDTIAPDGASGIVITGTTGGIPAGSAVSIRVSDGDPATPDVTITAITDADGRFSVTADLSSLSRGALTVSASVGDVTASDVATKLNAAPAPQGDTLLVVEDTALTISPATLLGNDSDADGDALSISSVQGAVNGSVALVNGNAVFTPAANYHGPASFTYTVADGQGGSSTASVTLAISAVNDAPDATPDAIDASEDTPVTIAPAALLGNDSDADGDSLTIVSVQQPVNGSVALVNGSVVFTPAPNFSGAASFAYTVSDSRGGSTTATAIVNVASVNDAPLATGDVVSATEDTPLTISPATLLGNDSDAEGGPLVIVSVQDAANGSVALVNGNVVFTPAPDYTGPASFSYTVTDAEGASSTAIVSLNVAGVNDAAVITPGAVTLTESDAPLRATGTLAISDVDSPAGFVAAASSGNYGTLTIDAAGNWEYVTSKANNDFVGDAVYVEQFTVLSADGTASTVTVNIIGTNDAAVITAATATAAETDAPVVLTGQLFISDVDSAATFAPASTVGKYGTLDVDADGKWSFTASSAHDAFEAGKTYTDVFTVTSADGTTSTVTIDILGTNDAAVISAATGAATETDAPVVITGQMAISDVDSAASFAAASTVGKYGTLQIDADGKWTFTASSAHDAFEAGKTYTEVFTVTSADGTTSTVTIDILGTNDAAVITASTGSAIETDAPVVVTGQMAITDVDSATTFAPASTVGKYGTLDIDADGKWTFTASSAHDAFEAGQTYTDEFTVASADGTTGTVTIDILGTNDAAVITASSGSATETNAPVVVTGQIVITDVDSAITFTAGSTVGKYGTLEMNSSGSWTFTASSAHDAFEAGRTYTDVFTVTSADGTTSTVTIDILGTNDAAVITASTGSATETDAPVVVTGQIAITDVDSATTFAPASTVGKYGTLDIDADGRWTFTASSAHDAFEAGQTYTDEFTVASADGTTSTVTIDILGTNDAAVITASTGSATESDTPVVVSGQIAITDVDSAITFAAGSTVGKYGTLEMNSNGSWTFTASSAHDAFEAGKTYTDVFTVTSADGTTSTVTIDILGTNDAAVITASTGSAIETDAPVVVTGQMAITDVDSATTFAPASTVGKYGTLDIDADGKWTFTASSAHDAFEASQTYTDEFTVVSADGTTSTVTIDILGTNDAAVITASSGSATETNAPVVVTGQIVITDVDSAITFAAGSTVGKYGTLEMNSNGSWTFTASSAHDAFEAGKTYTEVFTVTSADGTTSTVTIDILGTNDAAVITASTGSATESDTPVVVTGQIAITDVDSAVTFAAGSTVGTYGTLEMNSNGSWTFTANSAHDAFEAGKTYTDVFTVTSADGTTNTVTIDILGTNDAAVITASTGSAIETDAPVVVTGQMAITDVDSATTFAPASTVGKYGTLDIDADGKWTFTASSAHDAFEAGQTYTDEFTVASADGTTSTVTIDILGTNDAAVITASTGSATETDAPAVITGQIAITDVDSAITFAAGSTVGKYGTLEMNSNGSWTFTASSAHDAFEAGQTYTDEFTVASADGTTGTVTIDILGTNDAAVITASTGLATETDAPVVVTGQMAITDVDSAVTFAAGSTVGTYGTLEMNSNGSWTFTASSAHDAFEAGKTYTEVFTVTSADGTASTVTIDILGTNDAAVITASTGSATETDAPVVVTGQMVMTDVDSATTFAPASTVGKYGTLDIAADGKWTFTASSAHAAFEAGQTYTDEFTVASADGTTSTVTISILGTNDAAVITASTGSATETDAPVVITGQMAITDVDSATTFAPASTVGKYGTLDIDADGKWTFTASSAHDAFEAGQTYTDEFTVASADGTTSTVTISILGTNDAAVITAATGAAPETDAPVVITGQMAISDVDSAITFAPASTVGQYGTLDVDADGKWTFTASSAHDAFEAGQTYTDEFTVVSADGTTSTVTINILGTNDAAVITAATGATTETDAPVLITGQMAISDVDSATTFAPASTVGQYGTLDIDADGKWTFTAGSAHDAFEAGKTYTDQFTVASADGTTSTVTISILGTNDAAVITAATENLSETDTAIVVSGKMVIADVDSATTFMPGETTGKYGSLTMQTNGTWTYTASSAHDAFVEGEVYVDKFSVTSADGTTSTVTINILGTADAAIIKAATANLTETDQVLTTAGKMVITDMDSDVTFISGDSVGKYGALRMEADGSWTYTASSAHDAFESGKSYVDQFTVTSADGTTSTVTINILGSNDAAVITASIGSATETDAPVVVTGQIVITDVDSATTFTAGSTAGKYGTLEMNSNGSWTFTASSAHDAFEAGKTYTDVFTVTSADGTTSTVTINILGTNDAAAITASSGSATESDTPVVVTGQMVITDVDSPTTFTAGSTVGKYGTLEMNSNGSWTFTASSAHDGFEAGKTYTDVFTVTSADGTTSTVIIDILGTNDAAVISAATGAATETDAPVVITGQMAISDVDSAASFAAASTIGKYGTLQIDADGKWTFTASSAHDAFEVGQTYTEEFTITSADGTSSTLTISILGTNDAALITASSGSATESDIPVVVTGQMVITDVDSATTFAAGSTVGKYGTLEMNSNGSWTFTASSAHDAFEADKTYTDVFTVTSADGTTSTVTIDILGTNDAAVITASSGSATESDVPVVVTGQIAITDVDSPTTFTAGNTVGNYGTLEMNSDGSWTFTASSAHDAFEAGKTYTDVFTVISADGTTSTVTIDILGTNDAAVITASTSSATESDVPVVVTGQIAITDVDSPTTFTAGNTVGKYGTLEMNSNGSWTFTASSAHDAFEAGKTYTDVFTVTSADGTTSTVTIDILGTNDAAVVTASSGSGTESDVPVVVTGQMAITDVDSAITFVAGSTVGKYGTLEMNSNGSWAFTASSAHDAFEAGKTYTDVFTVTSADGTTSTVTIDILGTNDAAVITASSGSATESDVPVVVTGQIAITDVDSPTTFTAGNTVGTYGTLEINSDGSWTFTTSSAHDAFEAGKTYTDVFTVTSADGTTSTVTIDILGTNDAAVITASTGSATEGDVPVVVTGQIAITDIDSPTTFTAGNTVGKYGTLEMNSNGSWTFTASSAHDAFEAGKTYTDVFTVTSADGTTSTVTIDILGTNDAAVITASSGSGTESDVPVVVTGQIAITDIDSASTFTAGSTVGNYGTLEMNSDGSWTFTASSAHDAFEAGKTYTDVFTVTSADGTTSTVTIDILGTNDPAVITASSGSATESDVSVVVTGQIAIADIDSAINFTAGSTVGKYGTLEINSNGSWTFTASSAHDAFEAGKTYTDVFTVTSADGTTSTVTIDILGTNDAAVITASSGSANESDAPVVVTGQMAITDVDSAFTFVGGSTVGKYGTLEMNSNGSWAFTASSAHDAFEAGKTYTDVFTVTSADGTTSTVTIDILGTNDAAVITASTGSATESDVAAVVTGQIAITDVDSPATFTAGSTVGQYGTLEMNSNGSWAFTASSAHDAFEAGKTYTDVFTVTSADGTTSTVTIEILGTNDAAVITASSGSANESDVPVVVTGQIAITDIDSAITFTAGSTVGKYGTLEMNSNGGWTFTASSAHDAFEAGKTYTDVFTVTSADGTTSTVTIDILGTNDAAVITASSGSGTESDVPVVVTGQMAITDVDSAITFVAGSTVGKYGTLEMNSNGSWAFTASSAHDAFEAGKTYTDVFTVTSADGTTSTVTIDILGTNDAAVITASTSSATESDVPVVVTGQIAITDVDSPTTFTAGNTVGKYGTLEMNSNGSWTFTASSAHDAFEAGKTYTDVFTVTSADGSTSTVTIDILGTNDAAVITASSGSGTESDVPVVVTGQIAITDIDSASTFTAGSTVGKYGTLEMNSDGSWTFTASSAHDAFEAGKTYTDVFTVTSADGTTSTVTIDILGTNDAAVITASSGSATESDVSVVVTGQIAIADIDSAINFTAGSTVGKYGTLEMNSNGSWTFTTSSAHDAFEAGKTYTDVFTVTSADGTTSTVTIDILGTNDAAVITASSGSGTESDVPVVVTGQMAITDVDSAITFVAGSTVGKYGTLEMNSNGSWAFTASSAHDAFEAGKTYTDVFTVTSADGTTSTVTIDILGTNDAAVITASTGSATESDVAAVVTGQIAITDVDSPTTFTAGNTVGKYGTLEMNSNGSWTFTASSAHDAFEAGKTYTDVFTVTSADGTTSTVTIEILGTNDAAVITASSGSANESDAPVVVTGQMAITDVDSAFTFVGGSTVGKYGTLEMNSNGSWAFTASSAHDAFEAGKTYTDVFTVTSADGTTSTVTIDILGTNDAAVITASTGSATESDVAAVVTGQIAITDVDSPATFTAGSTVGQYGTLEMNSNGSWTFTASSAHDAFEAGKTYTDVFTVTSADGTTSTVTIDILGTNDAAVITASSGSANESDAPVVVTGQMASTDVDSAITFVAGSTVGKYGTLEMNSNGSWTFTTSSAHDAFEAGKTYTDVFTVTSADGTTSTVTIDILGTNDAAVITASSGSATESDVPVVVTGQIAITEVDSPTTFTAGNTVGNYGTLEINSDGSWTFTTSSAHDAFEAGKTYTDVFTVTSADGTTSTVTIDILGTNDAAVITASTGSATEGDVPVVVTGQIAITDIDSPTTFTAGNTVGKYGTLEMNSNGSWTFTASSAHDAFEAGKTYTDVFTVTSADGTTSTVTIDILGTNDAAVITASSGSGTESDVPVVVTGQIAITDIDSASTFTAGSTVGNYGTLEMNSDGSWTFTASSAHDAFEAGKTYTDVFTVTSADGTTSTVTIDILGTNDPAVITASSGSATESDVSVVVTGQIAIADIDSAINFTAGSTVGKYGTLEMNSNGSWTFTTSSAHDAFEAGKTYTDVFTVTSADGTTSTVTIDILGTNDAAVITASLGSATESDVPVVVTGQIAITDVDSPTTFTAGNTVGKYGTLEINSNGSWTFTASSAHDAFEAGKTYTDVFTVTSADGSTSTVSIDILGTNDAAVITASSGSGTESDIPVVVTGQIAITDVDSPTTFTAGNTVGTYGTLEINSDGSWTFTASSAHDAFEAGKTYTDVFTVTSADGTTSTVTIDILGTNDAAVITASTGSATEGDVPVVVTGQIAITDVDSPTTFTAGNTVGKYGTLEINSNGSWTFTASSAHDAFEAGKTYTDVFTVTSADGTTSTVTINILGTNDAAVITAGTGSASETNAALVITGQMAITDVDSPTTFVQTTRVGQYGSLVMQTNGSWTFTASSAHDAFEAGKTYTDVFTVTSADGTTSTVTINILGTNDAAVITAGTGSASETNAALVITGQMAITDVDSPTTFVQTTRAGQYGSLAMQTNGSWTFTASSAHDAFEAGKTYTDVFTVTSADGTTSTVTINILGTNDAAVITAGTGSASETNAALVITGQMAITDVDSPTTFVQTTRVGQYGSLVMQTNGSWTFTASSAHDAFEAGKTYTDVFTVTSADGTTSTVTINILGTNDAAVITAGTGSASETNAALVIAGQMAITDVDSPTTFVQTTRVGQYGSLVMQINGSWTFTASSAHDAFEAGKTYTDVFTVTSADGTTSTVTINILGTNDAAVITAGTGSASETNAALVITGQMAITDVDSPTTFVQTTRVGQYGSLAMQTNGSWTFTASSAHDAFEAGKTYTDVFTVTSSDGTTSTVTINILGTNDAAVLGKATVTLTETNAVLTTNGTLSITDVDSPQTYQAGTVTGTYGDLTVNSAGAWNYTSKSAYNNLAVGQTYTETFTVRSHDNTPTTVTINIVGSNDAPVAADDANSVTEDAASTTLSVSDANGLILSTGLSAGRDTDVDGDTLTITGVRTGTEAGTGTAGAVGSALSGEYGSLTLTAGGGYTYVLRNSSAAVQNLMAGETGLDVFTYTVSDGKGGFDTATLTISVKGSMDQTAKAAEITALPNAANGLTGAYYGYNETSTTSGRIHSDDGTARFGNHGVAGNLNSVEDLYTIINGRNVAAGGLSNIAGSADSAIASSADVTFLARTLAYGISPTVTTALGNNSAVAAGGTLPAGDGTSGRSLANFLNEDSATGRVQTGASNGTGSSGLGVTTDAAIRMSGMFYVQPGFYDFRVYADDGFRLNVAGQTLIEFDGNQAPTTRVFKNVQLKNDEGGLQDIELLYWEQGGNAVLRIEYRPSDSTGPFQTLSLSNLAMFSKEAAPTLDDPQIQDLVYDSNARTWQLRTGSRLDGDDVGNTLTGGAGRDLLMGNGGNDVLYGLGGADRLDGGAGDDILEGGDGNDLLIGGTGADTLRGGAGDDIYIISDNFDSVVEYAGAGSDTIVIDASFTSGTLTLSANIEHASVQGTGTINLTGNALDNRLEGNAGANTLNGGDGNDYLIGGGGNDTLIGGAGSDIFAWRLADRGTVGAAASDTITGFEYNGGYSTIESTTAGVARGGGDVLDLRDLLQGERTSAGDANGTAANVEISNLLNYIHVEVVNGSTVLHISANGGLTNTTGGTGADQTITLSNVNLYTATAITAGDETSLLKMLIKMGTLRVD
ncbi:VCBS domain-containing protein [Massilia sp. PAMC28688]|uniref:VCBS domain-containing protein n=1 Tax=Massilia sp. PAMC28688 TaxID=2861283 RepID=UPI001C627D53|nr:VCBS domain-containing protein [Massilia sp. PAMC28688]QYF93780.1 VCBS domain-containing protein [Massilia sp. PAMC28688]